MNYRQRLNDKSAKAFRTNRFGNIPAKLTCSSGENWRNDQTGVSLFYLGWEAPSVPATSSFLDPHRRHIQEYSFTASSRTIRCTVSLTSVPQIIKNKELRRSGPGHVECRPSSPVPAFAVDPPSAVRAVHDAGGAEGDPQEDSRERDTYERSS
ncbi:hypothetical protein AVEN_212121-1 [Araneus ventricosus]|uniref:Uncharacterized protein n=1 Tax=Araneus ventricosus TaxID=182803 RepID=A0A4Y2VFV9_ARAVE|nr:hypothetical protein AVEN_212121-1 [Araneus ventricosus]